MKCLLLITSILFLCCGQAFPAGDIIDRWATNAETTAQTRKDVGLTPANIPYLPAGGGSGNITAPNDIGDNKVLRGHGGAKNVQDTNVTIDDDDNVTTPGKITATKGIACGANANPGYDALDSDCPGTDKDVGGAYWQYVDGADGSENANYSIKITQGGVEDTVIITFNESEDRWEIPAGKHFAATGNIMGGINVVEKSAAYTVGTDDAYESYGTMFLNSDNDTQPWELPAISGNMRMCFQNGSNVSASSNVTAVNNNNIVYDGTPGSANGTIESGGALGDMLCLYASNSTTWRSRDHIGTWGAP